MDVKILFFIVINFYCINSTPYDINHLLKRGEKFCGDRLWRVVSLACQGNYNSPDKRVCKYSNYTLNFFVGTEVSVLNFNVSLIPFLFLSLRSIFCRCSTFQLSYLKALLFIKRLMNFLALPNRFFFQPCLRFKYKLLKLFFKFQIMTSSTSANMTTQMNPP